MISVGFQHLDRYCTEVSFAGVSVQSAASYYRRQALDYFLVELSLLYQITLTSATTKETYHYQYSQLLVIYLSSLQILPPLLDAKNRKKVDKSLLFQISYCFGLAELLVNLRTRIY